MMPTYCDKCEAVIDRDEELTRVGGEDFCLDCANLEALQKHHGFDPTVGLQQEVLDALEVCVEYLKANTDQDEGPEWTPVQDRIDRAEAVIAKVAAKRAENHARFVEQLPPSAS